MINTMSIYPNGIDSMIFFQDNNIEKLEIINIYNDLISEEKYNEANNFINQQEGVYGFFADYLKLRLNLLDNSCSYLIALIKS